MAIHEKYQPHWVWGLAFVVVPVLLIAIGFAGESIGSPVPFGLASTAPKIAIVIATLGVALALNHGRRVPLQIAGTGATLVVAGSLLLWWLGT